MIRRPVHALLSALALALAATAMSLMLATCEHYPSDLDELEAPSLTGFAVTPDSVDVTHDPGLVTASVSVRSPGGADSAVVVVASPSGAETLACVARAPAGGSRQNGRWECAVTFAPGHEMGVWHAARVEVHFAGGEVLRLLGDDLRTADLNTGVLVAMSLPPTVSITAPGEGASFVAGDAVRFEGQGTSFLGARLAGSALVWTSSIDGEIGTGTSFTTSGLSEGTHTITLTGTDARGLSGTAAVRVVVDERIAVATIQVTPEAAALSKLGESVSFTALAFDRDGREIPDVAFEWASLNPTVATIDAAGVATARGRGIALIRARAADVVGVASLTVDAPPSIGIVAPIDDASFVEGDEIHFEGWATRMDGEMLPDSALRWVSDRDGAIGTGGSLRAKLSQGSHAITLTATTEYGLSSTAHTRIRVEEPPAGVASIRIDPAAAGVTGTDATLRFTARAFDSAEREILDVVFEWSSDHPRVATVDANGLVTAHDLGATQIRARVGDVEAAAAFAVGPPSLRIESPAYGASFTVGDAITFLGTATSADGTPLTGSALVWSSSSGTFGTGNSFRSASLPVGNHTITLTATDRYGLVSADFVSIDVYPHSEREISFITILPEAASVQMGDTVHLSATAYDDDWVEIPGVTFAWSSEIPEMASVDGNGVVTGVWAGEGSVEITATVGGVNASVWVQVNPPEGLPRAEIIAPTDGSVVVLGDTVHFVGRGIGIDGEPITDDENFWWRDTDGRLLGGGRELSVVLSTLGEHTISFYARDNSGFVASEFVTVFVEESTPGAPVVASVAVYPRSAPPGGMLPIDMTIPFTAVAYDSGWTELSDIVFVWTSSDSTIATVNGDGEVTGRGPGRVTISAAVGSVSGAYEIEVSGPPIVRITAPADGARFLFGDSITFDATVTHTAWIPDSATVWVSSIDGVLDYYHPFTTTALSVGSHLITLTATDGYGASGADTIRIEIRAPSAVHRIEITPAEAGLAALGDTVRFQARAFDEFGEEVPDVVFIWAAHGGEVAPVATIDADGRATAHVEGIAVIAASVGDVRAEATLFVGKPFIEITAPQPLDPDVEPPVWGSAITFQGRGVSRADDTLAGEQLVWASSIDGPFGTGESFTTSTLSAGMHAITLTGTDRFGLSAIATIDTFLVMPSQLHAIQIDPPVTVFRQLDETVQLAASAYLISGDELGEPVPDVFRYQWLSSDPSIVTVDTNGLATARGWGEVEIIAITNTGLGSARIFVGAPDFESIHIRPSGEITLDEIGDTYRVEAEGHRRRGEVGEIIPGVPVLWTSDDPTVATIDARGLITARGAGSTIIRATLGDLMAYAQVQLGGPVPDIDFILVQSSGAELQAVGDTLHFTARAFDRYEREITGIVFEWTTSDPLVATVDSNGVVTARGYGEANIVASFGQVVGEQTLYVRRQVTYRSLHVGSGSTCGLTDEGTAYCWGYNFQGKLGDGVSGANSVPRPVPVAGDLVFETIAVGDYHMVGLTRDGRAYAWGGNEYGQLGDGTTTVRRTPVPVAGG